MFHKEILIYDHFLFFNCHQLITKTTLGKGGKAEGTQTETKNHSKTIYKNRICQ